jgi:APA family basic amino acid/polyamine antiporter
MARDNLFFRPIGKLNDRGVPANAIWFLAACASLLALLGTFDQITTSVIFAVWVFTALVGSSLFVLRRKLPVVPRRYRTVGYPVVPALFVVVAVWLIVNTLSASPVESAAGVVLIVIGLPVYFYMRRRGWLQRARMRERPD